MTEARNVIILPTDVDDGGGIGWSILLDELGIQDQVDDPREPSKMREAFFQRLADLTDAALTDMGYEVVRSRDSADGLESYDLMVQYSGHLAEIDEYPCDMAALWRQAAAETIERP